MMDEISGVRGVISIPKEEGERTSFCEYVRFISFYIVINTYVTHSHKL
jgi:hypothetical protein